MLFCEHEKQLTLSPKIMFIPKELLQISYQSVTKLLILSSWSSIFPPGFQDEEARILPTFPSRKRQLTIKEADCIIFIWASFRISQKPRLKI